MSTSNPLPITALVVGGGIGGMATAITLRKLGVPVDLIDLDPEWRVYGAGITITGATLRAFGDLGILDEVRACAYAGDGIQICDTEGRKKALVPTPLIADVDLPSSGGIMRPVLHRILSRKTVEWGANVRLGLTVDDVASDEDGVDVRFSDGTSKRYDLVVGADGLFSKVRTLLFPDAPRPEYTGQTIWRTVAPRPADIDRRHFFLGGPLKVGLTPVSNTQMYMFALETTPRRPIIPDDQLPAELARLLESYGGPVRAIRETLGPASSIIVRPLEGFLLPGPWYRGRTLLIGDAAHPTTPQLASGAGMAVEDALVLGDELSKATSVPQALEAFMARRYARCRLVVENSIEIGRREQRRAPIEDQASILAESLRVLAEPI